MIQEDLRYNEGTKIENGVKNLWSDIYKKYIDRKDAITGTNAVYEYMNYYGKNIKILLIVQDEKT